MPDPLTPPGTSTLERYTPDILRLTDTTLGRQAALAALAGGPGGPGKKPTAIPPDSTDTAPRLPVDEGPGPGPATGIPARAPEMLALTQAPVAGSVLKTGGDNAVGNAIQQLLRMPGRDPNNPAGSDWTNRNDIRLVLPIMKARDGAISSSVESLPGRNQSWATVQVGSPQADAVFNGDGINAAVRLGIGGPMMSPWAVTGMPMALGQAQTLQWAEFRVGAEGLVATGRVVDGKFSLTGVDVTSGFFKAKLDAVGDWATNHLAIAIPVGLAAATGAAFAAHAIAGKTGTDLAVPLSVPVYNKNGIFVSPQVRPIFGKDQFLKFGGAEVNLGYQMPGKFSVNVMPGYNNDPNLGPKGMTIGGRVNVAMPFNGVAGAEVRYNPQGGVSAFVGVGFTF